MMKNSNKLCIAMFGMLLLNSFQVLPMLRRFNPVNSASAVIPALASSMRSFFQDGRQAFYSEFELNNSNTRETMRDLYRKRVESNIIPNNIGEYLVLKDSDGLAYLYAPMCFINPFFANSSFKIDHPSCLGYVHVTDFDSNPSCLSVDNDIKSKPVVLPVSVEELEALLFKYPKTIYPPKQAFFPGFGNLRPRPKTLSEFIAEKKGEDIKNRPTETPCLLNQTPSQSVVEEKLEIKEQEVLSDFIAEKQVKNYPSVASIIAAAKKKRSGN